MASKVRRFFYMNQAAADADAAAAASSTESNAVTLLSGPPSWALIRHLHKSFPAAVIVDDFGELFDERNCQEKYANPRGRDLAMVRTLALCHNTAIHASKKGRCEILLADTQYGDSPRLLYIYKRWVSSIFSIKGDGCGSFLLSSSSNKTGNGDSIKRETAKYSIALQYLSLEAMDDDSEQ